MYKTTKFVREGGAADNKGVPPKKILEEDNIRCCHCCYSVV